MPNKETGTKNGNKDLLPQFYVTKTRVQTVLTTKLRIYFNILFMSLYKGQTYVYIYIHVISSMGFFTTLADPFPSTLPLI